MPAEKYNPVKTTILMLVSVITTLAVSCSHAMAAPQENKATKHLSISDDESKALDLVKKRPDVQSWLHLFTGPNNTSPSTGGRPVIAIIEKPSPKTYIVQAYEEMSDHQATFAYYKVDLLKMRVSEYDFQD